MASALRKGGLKKDDRIAFLAWNSEPLLLAHYGVPQAGGILVAINTRLSPDEIAYIVEHSGSTTVFHSPELEDQLAEVPSSVRRINLSDRLRAFSLLRARRSRSRAGRKTSTRRSRSTTPRAPRGARRASCTTTGARSTSTRSRWRRPRLANDVRYLWTLPMFHCNGWCFTWGWRPWAHARLPPGGSTRPRSGPAHPRGGRHPPERRADGPDRAGQHPREEAEKPIGSSTTAARPPSPRSSARCQSSASSVTHVYGLTETYGPHRSMAAGRLNDLRCRRAGAAQGPPGVGNLTSPGDAVVDEKMNDVPPTARRWARS